MSLQPRPHQVEAIDSAASALSIADRTTVVMACGTGKTLVGQRAVESVLSNVDNPIILHLSPSLGLLDQSYRAWVENSAREFEAIAVCSDTNIGKDDDDGYTISDLSLQVTTDSESLTQWISSNSDKTRVIFATFQSSQAIVDSNQKWNMAVIDEAHRTASRYFGLFSTILNDAKIKADKRLFMTATPKVWITANEDAISMDDTSVYGDHCYTLTSAEAVESGILADYQVVVSAVRNKEAQQIIKSNPRLSIPGHKKATAEMAASQTVLNQAIREYDLHRVLVFHNRISESKRFTSTLQSVTNVLPKSSQAGVPLIPVHIDGKHGAKQRQEILRGLEHTGNDATMIVSNVRTLSEGIDVPALDAIMFADPRTSRIEIAQAVGRVMRPNPKRAEPSVIILSVFLEDGDNPEDVISNSKFAHVWHTLRALGDNDIRFSIELDEKQVFEDRAKSTLPERIKFVGFGSETGDFLKHIETVAIEMLTPSWNIGLREFDEYFARTKSTHVPVAYVSPSGYSLGSWMEYARRSKRLGTLTKEREDLLNLRNVRWEKMPSYFEGGISHFKEFFDAFGAELVPYDYVTPSKYKLGWWVAHQRKSYSSKKLSKVEIQTLNDMQFVWNMSDHHFATGLKELEAFRKEFGHSVVPTKYVSKSGHKTGYWTSVQRREMKSGKKYPYNRMNALNQLGFKW